MSQDTDEIKMITTFEFLYSLFNKNVFYEAKSNIDVLSRYFRSDFNTSNSTLVHALLTVIRERDFDSITPATFVNALEGVKTEQEISEVVAKVGEFKKVDKAKSGDLIDRVRKACYKQVVEEVFRESPNDAELIADKLRKYEYKSARKSAMISKRFSQMDLTFIMDVYNPDSILPSRYDFINASMSVGGFLPNILVTISAAPGVGKTLYLMGEAVNFIRQGKRVHYTALGDMAEGDFLIRMGSMYLEQSLEDSTLNINQTYADSKDAFEKYFQYMIVPSATITATEYHKYMLSIMDDYDIFMCDYDGNFSKDDENMYQEGGALYDKMIDICRTGNKLGFIASQPKQSYWNLEDLPMEALAESSRKQQITDMIIMFGKSPNAGTRCGKASIRKNRRGRLSSDIFWVALEDGSMFECSWNMYAGIKNSPKEFRFDKTKARDTESRSTVRDSAE